MSALFSKFVYLMSYVVCHQLPKRSFQVFEMTPCFCARCMGIYSGFFLILNYFFGYKVGIKKQKIRGEFSLGFLLFCLSLILLMGVDVLLQALGFYFSNVTRVFSGLFFSFGLSMFIFSLFSNGKSKELLLSIKERIVLFVVLLIAGSVVFINNTFLIAVLHVLAGLGVLVVFFLLSIAVLRFIFRVKFSFLVEAIISLLMMMVLFILLIYVHSTFALFDFL